MHLEERVAWAINFIKKRDGLNNIQIGKTLGSNKNTIQAYTKGKGDLKGSVLAGIVKYYEINGEWLIAGNGEPYPGAREKYPEVCGPEGKTVYQDLLEKSGSSILQPTARSGITSVEPTGAQFRIADALTMCSRVLESGTSYATALYVTIQHFDRAITAEEDISKLITQQIAFEKATQDHFRELEERMDDLVKRDEELLTQNKALQREVNRLKATYEDPDGGKDSLTNTSGSE